MADVYKMPRGVFVPSEHAVPASILAPSPKSVPKSILANGPLKNSVKPGPVDLATKSAEQSKAVKKNSKPNPSKQQLLGAANTWQNRRRAAKQGVAAWHAGLQMPSQPMHSLQMYGSMGYGSVQVSDQAMREWACPGMQVPNWGNGWGSPPYHGYPMNAQHMAGYMDAHWGPNGNFFPEKLGQSQDIYSAYGNQLAQEAAVAAARSGGTGDIPSSYTSENNTVTDLGTSEDNGNELGSKILAYIGAGPLPKTGASTEKEPCLASRFGSLDQVASPAKLPPPLPMAVDFRSSPQVPEGMPPMPNDFPPGLPTPSSAPLDLTTSNDLEVQLTNSDNGPPPGLCVAPPDTGPPPGLCVAPPPPPGLCPPADFEVPPGLVAQEDVEIVATIAEEPQTGCKSNADSEIVPTTAEQPQAEPKADCWTSWHDGAESVPLEADVESATQGQDSAAEVEKLEEAVAKIQNEPIEILKQSIEQPSEDSAAEIVEEAVVEIQGEPIEIVNQSIEQASEEIPEETCAAVQQSNDEESCNEQPGEACEDAPKSINQESCKEEQEEQCEAVEQSIDQAWSQLLAAMDRFPKQELSEVTEDEAADYAAGSLEHEDTSPALDEVPFSAAAIEEEVSPTASIDMDSGVDEGAAATKECPTLLKAVSEKAVPRVPIQPIARKSKADQKKAQQKAQGKQNQHQQKAQGNARSNNTRSSPPTSGKQTTKIEQIKKIDIDFDSESGRQAYFFQMWQLPLILGALFVLAAVLIGFPQAHAQPREGIVQVAGRSSNMWAGVLPGAAPREMRTQTVASHVRGMEVESARGKAVGENLKTKMMENELPQRPPQQMRFCQSNPPPSAQCGSLPPSTPQCGGHL